MARKPDGTVAAGRSRTAILAALASAAAFKRPGERKDFIEESRLRVGVRDVYRALELRRRPAGPEAPTDPGQREWIWWTMEADTAKLGLDLIVAWLPPPPVTEERRDQASLLAALRSTSGVLTIDDCYDDTVVIRAVATDPLAKRQLQSRLRELCPQVLWTEVRQVDHAQPGRGWLGVAKAIAEQEGRLEGPARSEEQPSAA